MSAHDSLFRTTRRRFAFWVGLGMFGLSEKLHAAVLDDWAAALMHSTEGGEGTAAVSETVAASEASSATAAAAAEHWVSSGNRTWRWYERETLVDGRWKVTGITTPVNRTTGELYVGRGGYLDESVVPANVRRGEDVVQAVAILDDEPDGKAGQPSAARRARHGRPPSKWLRSLNADELRVWLKTIDPPEAGVSGMTFFEHLTRDHGFDAARITGLSIDEQAKLHAAAHHGY